MTAKELQDLLDTLGLTQAEAARLLYITPNVLGAYLNGQRKIPGPLVAAVEAWERHGPPPGAKQVSEEIEPGKLKLMKELRDSLAGDTAPPEPKRRGKKKGGDQVSGVSDQE